MFDDYLPDVVFHMRKRTSDEGDFVWERKTTSELFGGKKVLIFGLPGAFTPTCTNEQLPKYEEMYDEFIDKGIDEIWCTSVNDAFVMFQWARYLNIENVKMLPDGNGDFAKGLDMLVSKTNLGFGQRSWRYALIANDLKIEKTFEEDGYPKDNHPIDPYMLSEPGHVIKNL